MNLKEITIYVFFLQFSKCWLPGMCKDDFKNNSINCRLKAKVSYLQAFKLGDTTLLL